MIYTRPGCIRPIVIPRYSRGIQDEKIVRYLMKTSSINRKQFLELKARFE